MFVGCSTDRAAAVRLHGHVHSFSVGLSSVDVGCGRYCLISGCVNCVIVVGAVEHVLMVDRCERTKLIAAARCLRLLSCRECTLNVCVNMVRPLACEG